MKPHLPTAIGLACLALVGCSNSDDPEPPPPSAPTATTPADDGPPDVDEAALVDQYVSLQHAIIQLPPVDPDDIDPAGAGEGIVVEGSPAEAFITDQLSNIAETGVGPSGEVVDAAMLEVRDGGEQQSVDLCTLQDVTPVDIANEEPAEGPEVAEPRYTQIEVDYRFVDGAWLVEDLPDLERDGPPEDCVPPSVAEAIEANWQAHEQAVQDWVNSSFAIEDRAAFEPLVTDERWQQVLDTEPIEPTGEVSGDIAYDLELLQATAIEVVGEWCLDGNRDPDAMTIRNGELVKHEFRSLVRGRWELEDGEWRYAAYDESQGDRQILAGTVDAPEGHRCL